MIIDVHTHVFPDKIAQKAIESIGSFYGISVGEDGTVGTLLKLEEDAGIGRSFIHSVATTPKHADSINRFIAAVAEEHGDRLTGFGAIHPDCEDIDALIEDIKAKGLKGLKIHPDMQGIALDADNSMAMFEKIEGKLPIIIHTGDIRNEYSRPWQMEKVAKTFPDLICVCAHMGGWSEWTDAWKRLAALDNVYIDTSSSLYALEPAEAVKIIRKYDRQRVLFGTDYPMWTPKAELERFLKLGLSTEEEENILGLNALRLIGEIQ